MLDTRPLTYATGEEVRTGDNVLYHSERGRIEFVALRGDVAAQWYVQQYGSGCMVVTTGVGRVFIADPNVEEELEFVSRGECFDKATRHDH